MEIKEEQDQGRNECSLRDVDDNGRQNDLTGEGGLEQASEGVLTEALTASQEVLRTLLAD